MIQRMLAIWSLFLLPFLEPAWTYGSSWFMCCWSLAWRILSITLLACGMSAMNILWHCTSLGLERKLTFPSPVATAEFSNFAGILSTTFHTVHGILSPEYSLKRLMLKLKFQMFKLDLEKAEEPEIKLPTSVGSSKKQENSRRHRLLFYWLHQSLWLCRSKQTVENTSRDGNTRPPYLPPEKSVCRSRGNC